MRTTGRAGAVAAVVTAAVLAMIFAVRFSSDTFHGRDPYVNGVKIDAGLARDERQFSHLLSAHGAAQIIRDRTDAHAQRRMIRFLRGYAGHPTVVARMTPDNDATADEILTVTCRPGDVEQVMLIWGWVDGDWRAYPAYTEYPDGRYGDYPGC